MTEMVNDKLQSLKTVSLISYLLHLIVAVGAVVPGGQFGPLLLIVALIIDFVKRPDAEGTWQHSHFSYRIRTVFWAAGLYIVTGPLWLLFLLPGWIAWGLISLWFLYRIVKGMVRLNAEKPMES
jgi:uncharacterized membrane protein